MADQATVASENFGACAHQCLVAAEYFETFATLGVGCTGHQIVVVPRPPAADQLAKIGRPEKLPTNQTDELENCENCQELKQMN